MRLAVPLSFVAATAAALAGWGFAACLPSLDFVQAGAEAGPEAPTSDAGIDGADGTVQPGPEASVEASSEGAAQDAEAGPGPGAVLKFVDVGPVAHATGNSQQRHLVYARGSSRWWLFYFDGDMLSLEATSSPDLVTWTPGASLTLPQSHAGEGANLSVAYAQLGGVEVVHVGIALKDAAGRSTYHARAKVSGTTIAWDPLPAAMSSLDDGGDPKCDPDGPSVAITDDGHVLHATGWSGGCDDFIYAADVDTGQSWAPTFTQQWVGFVPWISHDRQLVTLQGSDALLTFDNGWDIPAPTNVLSKASVGGQWSNGYDGTVFPDAGAMTFQDWSTCKRIPLEIDSARRESADGGPGYAHWEHARLQPASGAWTAGDPIPDEQGVPGTGAVLLTNGTTMLLFAIASDYSIRYTRWSAGAWSAWRTAVPAPATFPRAQLASTGCELQDHAVLIWTEGASQSYAIMGVDVTGLF